MNKDYQTEQDEIDKAMSETLKNSIKIRNCLDGDFMNKLQSNIFSFRDITAKNIIDILCPENKMAPISTNDICKKLGIDLGDADKGYEGTIELDSKIKISFCEHSLCYKQRFTKAHELGHLFKHLINGLKMEFKDEKADQSSNNVQYEERKILATLKADTSDLSKSQQQYEKEASQFARELLLNDYALDFIIRNKKLSANGVLKHFKISKDTLVKRLQDRECELSNICEDDIPQLGTTF